jgi:hypothetical protein
MTESLPCSSLNFSVYTENGVDYVKIGENYAGLDGKESNIAGKIPMGKWVNIRVEFYKDYVEKESVIVSECYAYEEGEIKYVEKKGDIEVWIGDTRYVYNPLCMYYYPEGTKIKKYQRFCSGVLDANRMIKVLSPNINDIYYIFRRQFYELQVKDQDFTKLSINTIPEEMVEMLFISLIDVEYNTKNLAVDNIKFLGTCSGIENSKSFYTLLSYGNASKIINKTIKGEYTLKDDIMTETVLGLLLNNKLDENNNN